MNKRILLLSFLLLFTQTTFAYVVTKEKPTRVISLRQLSPGVYTIHKYSTDPATGKLANNPDYRISATAEELRAFVKDASPSSMSEQEALDILTEKKYAPMSPGDQAKAGLAGGAIGGPIGGAIGGMLIPAASIWRSKEAKKQAMRETHPFLLLLLSDKLPKGALHLESKDFPEQIEAEIEAFNRGTISPFEKRVLQIKQENKARHMDEYQRQQYAQ